MRYGDGACVILKSTITCPQCGHLATETMPTDACQFFYNCGGCGERLKAKAGELLRVLLLRDGAVSADAICRLLRLDFVLRGRRLL